MLWPDPEDMDPSLTVLPTLPGLSGEVMCTCSRRWDALLEENEDDLCKNTGGSGLSDQSGRGLDGGRLPMDSGVVDSCNGAFCKLDDRGDRFVGEGTGRVATREGLGGEELKGISLKKRDFGQEAGLGPL